jgi:hypothetical protein
MKDKRLLALGIAVTIAVLGIVYLVTRPRDPLELPNQKVTFSLPAGVSAEVYADDDEHGNEGEEKPVGKVANGGQLDLKAGSYMVLTGETSDYAEAQEPFSLGTKAMTVSVAPDYSERKLQSLLAGEQIMINAAIARDTPANAKKFYHIQPGKLYKKGDWFATRLTYTGPTSEYDSDTLTLVAQKKDGTWQVVTKPPTIVVSRVVYPEIPQDVADALNNP